MIKYLFYLSLYSSLDITDHLSSAIYENEKITVLDQYDHTIGNKPSISTYTIKDGPVSDIISNSISTKTTTKQSISNMVFLQLPSELTKDKSSKLWLMVNNEEPNINSSIIKDDEWTYRWTGSDTVSDNSLIAKPDIPNFPRGGFSATGVNINDNNYLYILGGIIYSTNLNATAITNYFFQYDFNTNKWSDLSDLTNNILPPTSNHKTFQLGKSLIAIPAATSSAKTSTIPQYSAYKNCSMVNNIDKIYKFDLQNNKWSVIDLDINMSNNNYPSNTLFGRSISIYNQKILVYAVVYTGNGKNFKPVIGLLDLDKLQWIWNSNIANLEAFQGIYPLSPESIVINDQLILINGANSTTRYKKIFALSLKNLSFLSTIDIDESKDSNNMSNNDSNSNVDFTNSSSQAFPTYAIVLIVLAALGIIIIIGWIFYRKVSKLNKANELEEKMNAVWVSSDIEQDARYSKNRGSKYNRNVLSALDINNLQHNNNEDTDTTINETNIMNLPYFQHEVDVQDLSPVNPTDQEKTS